MKTIVGILVLLVVSIFIAVLLFGQFFFARFEVWATLAGFSGISFLWSSFRKQKGFALTSAIAVLISSVAAAIATGGPIWMFGLYMTLVVLLWLDLLKDGNLFRGNDA